MKYLFIAVLIWAVYKLLVLKNIKNKGAYLVLCGICVFVGMINLLIEYSMADILKRWM